MNNNNLSDSQGAIITSTQVGILDYAVSLENNKNTDILKKKELQSNNLYNEILMNILIFGSGKYIKKYYPNSPSIEYLIKEGIIEAYDDNELNDQKYNLIKNAYNHAFMAYRELDQNHFTAPIVSYEEIFIEKKRPSSKEIYKINKWREDIKYFNEIFKENIEPLIFNLSEIFGYYFDQNIDIYHDILKNMYGKNKRKKKSFDKLNILNAMGLKPLNAEEFEKNKNNLINMPGISFSPDNLENLWLDPRYNTEEEYINKGMQLAFADNEDDFFYIQSFWKTVIEFQNILDLSSDKELPLIMSEDISVNNNLTINKNNDELGLFKIFLSERTSLPRLSSIEDLLRLRDDKRILPLKEILKEWNYEYNHNNKDLNKIIMKIRNDMNLAEKELKKFDKIKNISGLVGYINIPIGLIEIFSGTFIGGIAGAATGLINIISSKSNKKNQWLYWGL